MRPWECRMMTEDLECLGCGAKLALLKPGQCLYEEREQQEKERALLTRLKEKYESTP